MVGSVASPPGPDIAATAVSTFCVEAGTIGRSGAAPPSASPVVPSVTSTPTRLPSRPESVTSVTSLPTA